MARKSDQIWQVLSGAPATPAQPEGLVVFKPDQAWVRRSTDVTLPALSSKPHYITRLSGFSSSDKLPTDATRDVHGRGPRQPQVSSNSRKHLVGVEG